MFLVAIKNSEKLKNFLAQSNKKTALNLKSIALFFTNQPLKRL